MTEKNRKDSFHTVALHHHNRTQRADVCTRRQKNYISLLYIFLHPCCSCDTVAMCSGTMYMFQIGACYVWHKVEMCSFTTDLKSFLRLSGVQTPLPQLFLVTWHLHVVKWWLPPFWVKTAVLGLVYSSLGWVSGTALRVVGLVFRVSDVVSVLFLVEIDSCTSENTYDVRSCIFAFLAEEEPPFIIPGFAASDFCSTDHCRSPLRIHTCTFTWVPRGAFFPWSA